MRARWTAVELAGIALVAGAAMLAMSSGLPDQNVFEGLLIVSIGWIPLSSVERRSMGFALVAAAVAAFVAAMTVALGHPAAALMPFAITVHHVGLVLWAIYRAQREMYPGAAPDEPDRHRGLFRSKLNERPPLRPERAKLDDDPFRSPPQPPPIVVRRPPTAPATVPVEPDENAAKPKLLG